MSPATWKDIDGIVHTVTSATYNEDFDSEREEYIPWSLTHCGRQNNVYLSKHQVVTCIRCLGTGGPVITEHDAKVLRILVSR